MAWQVDHCACDRDSGFSRSELSDFGCAWWPEDLRESGLSLLDERLHLAEPVRGAREVGEESANVLLAAPGLLTIVAPAVEAEGDRDAEDDHDELEQSGKEPVTS